MDWDVIVRYKKELPNLYGLLEKNNFTHLRSVFPADTTPAWSTIYTGMDPSEHGIINFINVEAKKNTYKPLVFDDNVFREKTFWDPVDALVKIIADTILKTIQQESSYIENAFEFSKKQDSISYAKIMKCIFNRVCIN